MLPVVRQGLVLWSLGPSTKDVRWGRGWSNADTCGQGRGKGPCGHPQAGTFIIIPACFADALCVMPKYKLLIVTHLVRLVPQSIKCYSCIVLLKIVKN